MIEEELILDQILARIDAYNELTEKRQNEVHMP